LHFSLNSNDGRPGQQFDVLFQGTAVSQSLRNSDIGYIIFKKRMITEDQVRSMGKELITVHMLLAGFLLGLLLEPENVGDMFLGNVG
jgi:hypothetical protein